MQVQGRPPQRAAPDEGQPAQARVVLGRLSSSPAY
jgi:hypothetical protein